MKTQEIVSLLQQGKKPLVRLTKVLWDGDGWGEKGMIARILSYKEDMPDVVGFEFDYNEHKEHNLTLQGTNFHIYHNQEYVGLGTAFQSGYMKSKNNIHETVYYMTHGNGSDVPVEFVDGLLTEYIQSGSPEFRTYVEWLENLVNIYRLAYVGAMNNKE